MAGLFKIEVKKKRVIYTLYISKAIYYSTSYLYSSFRLLLFFKILFVFPFICFAYSSICYSNSIKPFNHGVVHTYYHPCHVRDKNVVRSLTKFV